jgi:putative resolvase
MEPSVDLKTIGWSANHIGVSVNTLRRWANTGRVPYVRLPSGQMRFLVSDLDAMIQRVEATEPIAAKAS